MNTLTLYKNTAPFPHFNDSIAFYKSFNVTPLHQNLRSGYVDLQLSLDDLMSFNYLSYERSGNTIYGWVTDAQKLGGSMLYRITFEIDAYRTYRSSIIMGSQWIERASNIMGYAKDPLYSAINPGQEIVTLQYVFPDFSYRTLVVQVRDESSSVTGSPLQPSPYTLYMLRYNVSNWTAEPKIVALIEHLRNSAEVSNIATIYSVPGWAYTSTDQEIHTIRVKKTTQEKLFNGIWDSTVDFNGWAKFYAIDVAHLKKSVEIGFLPDDQFKRVHNQSRLVFPDAGVMEIPEHVMFSPKKRITRYIDIYSGASNYVLEYSINDGVNWMPMDNMVRGSAIGNIPVLSSPADSYVSQNQNSLITQVLGDTAVLVGAGASMFVTGGTSLPVAGPIAASAASGLMNTAGNIGDADRRPPSNPPAVLGTALEPHYPGGFWLVWTSQKYDDLTALKAKMGNAVNAFVDVTIPSSGYLRTRGCSVKCNDALPLWAVQEINALFDNGIFFNI